MDITISINVFVLGSLSDKTPVNYYIFLCCFKTQQKTFNEAYPDVVKASHCGPVNDWGHNALNPWSKFSTSENTVWI